MPSDSHDELARLRARHNRERSPSPPGPGDPPHEPTEQEAAIARARESWLLSQLKHAAPQDSPAKSD